MAAERMLVVAAALIDEDGRVLIAQRPPGKQHAGQWEFPGGKVEPGETLPDALARELSEELGIVIDGTVLDPVGFAVGDSAGRELMLLLFAAREWQGTPLPLEHSALAWCEPSNIDAATMPVLDQRLLLALRRHPRPR